MTLGPGVVLVLLDPGPDIGIEYTPVRMVGELVTDGPVTVDGGRLIGSPKPPTEEGRHSFPNSIVIQDDAIDDSNSVESGGTIAIATQQLHPNIAADTATAVGGFYHYSVCVSDGRETFWTTFSFSIEAEVHHPLAFNFGVGGVTVSVIQFEDVEGVGPTPGPAAPGFADAVNAAIEFYGEGNGTDNMFLGTGTGVNATGNQRTAVGIGAGSHTDVNGVNMHRQTAVGHEAGVDNSGLIQTALGVFAGKGNSGLFNLALGLNSCLNNTGDRVIGLGSSGANNTGDDVLFLGMGTGIANTQSNRVVIGNAYLPEFADRATALAAITTANGASANSTYMYLNASNGAVEGVRL